MSHKLNLFRGILLNKDELKRTSHFKQWENRIKESTFRHLNAFWLIWGIFLILSLVNGVFRFIPRISQSYDCWHVTKWVMYIGMAIIAIQFLRRPMNVVYSLMGTSGSIQVFFANFILITLVFACIYHWGFFHNALISYDVNQPHICYDASHINDTRRDTTIYVKVVNNKEQMDTVVQLINYSYQPISFGQTWRNTLVTTLMQEPSDFFSVASTYNVQMDKAKDSLDKDKAAVFHWLLIVQILISWIFFGVFISILYNKFRYES